MQKSMMSGNIEKSILWATELHCSGNTNKLYTRLFDIFIKEINKANIFLLKIFYDEFNRFQIIKGYYENNLDLRNNQYIRNHINSLVCLLTFSPKYKLEKLPKIKPEDFNMNNNKSRQATKNLNKIQMFLKPADSN